MNKYNVEVADRELLDVVRRMALMAELRNSNLLGHLERVRGYCNILARGYGLPSGDVMLISYASQLHDIGLVGVPDTILSKTGELNAYEWDMMKRHPTIGADLLRGSLSIILQTAETIALTHHERWDGSGYPRGLRRDEIPLSGRICALADVFDALTTRRSYKAEIMVGDALKLIQDSSGQLFDPELVDVFHDNFGEVLKMKENYP